MNTRFTTPSILVCLFLFALHTYAQDLKSFRDKYDSLKEITKGERFNSRLEKVINTNEEVDTSSRSYKLKTLSLERGEAETYKRLHELNSSMMELLITIEKPTEFEKEVSTATRYAISVMDGGYELARPAREITAAAIVDAIERRDVRAATRLMDSHIANVERNLQRHPRVADLSELLQAP